MEGQILTHGCLQLLLQFLVFLLLYDEDFFQCLHLLLSGFNLALTK
jgi:hypothetical protein